MNDLLAAVSAYGTQFALWVLCIAALFALPALIASWFFSRRGWLDIAPGGPRWFRALAILAACLAGLTIGVIVGVQVGAIRTGMHLLQVQGPGLLKLGLAQVCEPLGLPRLEEKVSLERIRAVLDGIEDVRLVDSPGLKGSIVNAAFDAVRRPFVARADRFLSHLAPGDQASLAQLVDATWSHVERSVQRTGDALILSALINGCQWLATCALLALLGAWLARMATRPVEGPS